MPKNRDRGRGQVTAVLLAAGSSSRMGRPKQLLPIDGKPAILWCAEALALQKSHKVRELVIVTAKGSEGLEAAMEGLLALCRMKGLQVKIAVNDVMGSDMAGSVRAGLRMVSPVSSGVLVALSDHPMVSAETVEVLLERHMGKTPGNIIVPVHEGKRGHPALFPRLFLDEFFQFRAGFFTLRDLVKKHEDETVFLAVKDEGVTADMDTPEDYLRIKALMEGRGLIYRR